MNNVQSMEDRVILIVREFFDEIDKKEPFQTELMDFRLRFRAKLLEIVTSYPTNPELANRTLNYAVEAVERIIREEVEKVNLEDEESLYRTIETLKVVNEVLKEFMQEDRVKDKRKLSSLTGFIGGSIEKLRREYRQRFGGILNSIKRLFGFGRKP